MVTQKPRLVDRDYLFPRDSVSTERGILMIYLSLKRYSPRKGGSRGVAYKNRQWLTVTATGKGRSRHLSGTGNWDVCTAVAADVPRSASGIPAGTMHDLSQLCWTGSGHMASGLRWCGGTNLFYAQFHASNLLKPISLPSKPADWHRLAGL